MTPQEIFDKALVSVLKQGKPATKNGACVYYKEVDGTMCAVGLLLGPKLAMEWTQAGVGGVYGCSSHKVTAPDWVKDNLALLDGIQCAHDGQADSILDVWRDFFLRQMRHVAITHDLEYKEELERV